MSKTAEEILNSYLGEVNKELFKRCVEPAMHEFSAQEVEAYKIRVKDAISSAVDEAIADGKKTHMIMFNWKDIYTIIEGVK